jgi:hypothetical protein
MKSRYVLLSLLSILIFSKNIFAQANSFNCGIRNIIKTSANKYQFDVYLEWTGTNTQKLTFFQAGINFNYAGMANGGIINGSFLPGSADPSLPPIQQSPNWNINQSSKQIRMFGAIATPSSVAVPIPSPPGFRLGTFVMTNTVNFTQNAAPNFIWSFVTQTATTTKTILSCYINGATNGTDITNPAYFGVFIYDPCWNSLCPEVHVSGPYTSCGDVQLVATYFNANSLSWSTSGTGTFVPDNTTIDAIYHPSNVDLQNGHVTVTLTTTAANDQCCSAQFATSSALINFTSIDDNDFCTTDACDQSTGLPIHVSNGCQVTLKLKAYIQGFYTGNGKMDNYGNGGRLYVSGVPGAIPTDADTISVSAMNPASPYALVQERKVILQTDGNAYVDFGTTLVSGNYYYLRILHQNSIETWSKNPVQLSYQTSYNFTDQASKAYNDYQAQTADHLYFSIYSGDINQDGAMDGSDFLSLDPEIQVGIGGYADGDFNGDGAVDGNDFLILVQNF